ncbi:MAG TPA: hypothetical protein VHY76_08430 [Acetobacteraceae bacterium]|jgi:hypothetical protein|nr:hypothetical protein [Acetobacteraceae bacterium]
MRSSISSSDPASPAWRRFLRTAIGAALAIGLALYAFIVVVDPWHTLPLAPPLPRVPVTSNARFVFPALARSPRFDSAIFGTSTSRLLRPAVLDAALGARFANLAMNSATSWEQVQLLRVFARAHPHPRYVMIGLDAMWCQTKLLYQKKTFRRFPAWMYRRDLWPGYLHVFNAFALQEAVSEAATMAGFKRRIYGRDGYTDFTPPESDWTAARARAHIDARADIDFMEDGTPPPHVFPAHALLVRALAMLPPSTRKVLFFLPYERAHQGAPGSADAAIWAECKRRVARIAAATPETVLADFMRPSPITDDWRNYWDPMHYRHPIALRLAHDLVRAARGEAAGADDRILVAPTAVAASEPEARHD